MILGLDGSFVWDSFLRVADAAGRPDLRFTVPLKRFPGVRSHLFVFSEDFRRLLVALCEDRASLISRDWYANEGLSLPTQSEAEVQRRTHILLALSRLARVATDNHATLFLEVKCHARPD
jgi:hypothetical protein